MIKLFIPGNTPSSKNSKVATSRGVFSSPIVSRYLRSLGIQTFSSSKKTVKGYVDKDRPNPFKKAFEEANWIKPTEQVVIGFHFVRKSKHKFDFINACQLVHDLMVAHDLIEDDNMNYLIPIPFKMDDEWFRYDKENPGVFIRLYSSKEIKW